MGFFQLRPSSLCGAQLKSECENNNVKNDNVENGIVKNNNVKNYNVKNNNVENKSVKTEEKMYLKNMIYDPLHTSSQG